MRGFVAGVYVRVMGRGARRAAAPRLLMGVAVTQGAAPGVGPIGIASCSTNRCVAVLGVWVRPSRRMPIRGIGAAGVPTIADGSLQMLERQAVRIVVNRYGAIHVVGGRVEHTGPAHQAGLDRGTAAGIHKTSDSQVDLFIMALSTRKQPPPAGPAGLAARGE